MADPRDGSAPATLATRSAAAVACSKENSLFIKGERLGATVEVVPALAVRAQRGDVERFGETERQRPADLDVEAAAEFDIAERARRAGRAGRPRRACPCR